MEKQILALDNDTVQLENVGFRTAVDIRRSIRTYRGTRTYTHSEPLTARLFMVYETEVEDNVRKEVAETYEKIESKHNQNEVNVVR